VLGGFLLYFFLTDVEVFLCLLFLLELFSSVFQSVTLANRLSINFIAEIMSVVAIVSIDSFVVFIVLLSNYISTIF
jgi:F0F1-type ATP synthase membrane subunit a